MLLRPDLFSASRQRSLTVPESMVVLYLTAELGTAAHRAPPCCATRHSRQSWSTLLQHSSTAHASSVWIVSKPPILRLSTRYSSPTTKMPNQTAQPAARPRPPGGCLLLQPPRLRGLARHPQVSTAWTRTCRQTFPWRGRWAWRRGRPPPTAPRRRCAAGPGRVVWQPLCPLALRLPWPLRAQPRDPPGWGSSRGRGHAPHTGRVRPPPPHYAARSPPGLRGRRGRLRGKPAAAGRGWSEQRRAGQMRQGRRARVGMSRQETKRGACCSPGILCAVGVGIRTWPHDCDLGRGGGLLLLPPPHLQGCRATENRQECFAVEGLGWSVPALDAGARPHAEMARASGR